MKLNLGCGDDLKEGFVNVDFRDIDAPKGIKFLRADIRQYIESLEEGSVDYIHLQDIIEHFVRSEALDILKDCFSVLKPGGEVLIRAPDGLWLAHRLSNPEEDESIDPELYSWLIMGAQTYEGNYHYTVWTPEWMTSELKKIGFEVSDTVTGTLDDNNFILLAKRPKNG